MPDMFLDVDTAVTVPVNVFPLTDDTDFKTREVAVAYNASGMDLVWNFQTSAGVTSQTAVTPTTAGVYDWTHSGDGMYKIEIPASGGGSINNDTEGYGWFSGVATGVMPWRGPVIGFRAAAVNDALCDGGDILDTNTTQIEGLDPTDQINAACDTAIETYGLQYVLSTALPTSWTADVTPNSALDYMADDGTATYDRTTESLQAIRDRGDVSWLTGSGGSPPELLQTTTIATLASQTSFTLTAGSTDDGAYEKCMAVITDAATSTQKAVGYIDAYTGSTKTVTLRRDPGVFTMAATDNIQIVAKLDIVDANVVQHGQVDLLYGTAQSATSTTLVLAAATTQADTTLKGGTLICHDSTNGVQARLVQDWTSSTDTATVLTWDSTPTGTITYVFIPKGYEIIDSTNPIEANVTQWLGTAAATPSVAGIPEVDLTHVAGATTNVSAMPGSINAIEVDTSTTIPATIATAQADLDIITGADGANLLSATQASIDAIETDTSTTLQAELDAIQAAVITNAAGVDIAADIIAIKAETATIVADTGSLQIKKNTALAGFPFIMLSSSDHVTPTTGLTITATRSLDGAAFGACANAATELANGAYLINLAAADLNADTVILRFAAAGADDRFVTIITQPV